jgi:hypothetical protein
VRAVYRPGLSSQHIKLWDYGRLKSRFSYQLHDFAVYKLSDFVTAGFAKCFCLWHLKRLDSRLDDRQSRL